MHKQERNYGLDLLRICAMFMVVVLHVLGQGGVLAVFPALTFKGELAWALELLCYCATNCYTLISGYVGLRSRHRSSQIISLWLQVLFYSVLSTGVEGLSGSISLRAIVSAFFPVWTCKYWYFSLYFCLFFFIPILNHIIDNVPQNTLKAAFIPTVILFCVLSSIEPIVFLGLNDGYSLLWLIVMYLLGGYIAKYGLFKKATAGQCFLGYALCAGLLIGIRLLIEILTKLVFGRIHGARILVDYIGILMVLCSVFLLCGFSRLKIGRRSAKLIRIFSPAAFGVYLVHLTGTVWTWLDSRFTFFAAYPAFVMIGLVIVTALGIYSVCTAVELLRIQLFKLLRVNRFANWLETFLSRLTAAVLRILHLSPEPVPDKVE